MADRGPGSRAERLYDRVQDAVDAQVARQITDPVAAGRTQAAPSVLVIAVSFALCLGFWGWIGEELIRAFGLKRGAGAAIMMAGGLTTWMVLLVLLIWRRMARLTAQGRAPLPGQNRPDEF